MGKKSNDSFKFPGDLYVRISVENDEIFKLKGLNIISNLNLTPAEAILGTNIEFDFVLSTFDVFNYLSDFEEFKLRLKEVYLSLKKGGKFVFDIHTPKKVTDMLEKQVFGYEDEEISYLWFTYETENSLEVESELSFFLKENNGLYRKLEQFHSQRTYEIEEVFTEINNIGFKVKDYFCDFDKNNQKYDFLCLGY